MAPYWVKSKRRMEKTIGKNDIGEEFEQILRKYKDPQEIKKRLNIKKREEILEDKKSSFGLE